MQLLIDEIYNFYNNPQNLAAFEEWEKERNKRNDDTSIKSERKTS
jgi:hypothetical protein